MLERWRQEGEQLLETLGDEELADLAAAAARIHTLTLLRITGQKPTAALLTAHGAAKLLGPEFSAKWVYNHAKDLPHGCVRRIGRRVLFVGPRLKEWAYDSGGTITRERKVG